MEFKQQHLGDNFILDIMLDGKIIFLNLALNDGGTEKKLKRVLMEEVLPDELKKAFGCVENVF